MQIHVHTMDYRVYSKTTPGKNLMQCETSMNRGNSAGSLLAQEITAFRTEGPTDCWPIATSKLPTLSLSGPDLRPGPFMASSAHLIVVWQ